MAQATEQKGDKTSQVPENLQDYVGNRIEVDKAKGTIRYVGPVATSKKASTTWLGIEWDDANRGKNDGSVVTDDGTVHRYFTTDAGRASFIKPIKASFGRDLLTVILDRFSLDGLEDDLKEQQAISADSQYKIEFVGWDKSIRRQCNLSKKTSVNLEEHDVCYLDLNTLKELKQTVPEVETMELRRNLITTFDSFAGLSCLAETLREINFSHNPLNVLNYQTIQSLCDSETGFKLTFPNLTCFYLNNCKSAVFKPWQFVYILLKNGCLPKLGELQICCNEIRNFKLPPHVIHNDLEANPNDFGDDESKLMQPDAQEIAALMPHLQTINIGENPLTSWDEISDVFGLCPSLTQFKCAYADLPGIQYKANTFTKVTRVWMRNNKFTKVSVFDEFNKFPTLQQLNFIQNSFEEVHGFSTLRDLCIAKIPNLHVCNSSVVNAKERHDAELFYLKWIAKQLALGKEQQGGNNGDNDEQSEESKQSEEAEMERIEKLYPRYIELTQKHGAMGFDKKEAEKLLAITVTIKSMDPESITAKPVEKKLPTAMTVAQLKMLCKRLFNLQPQHQRLMFRDGGGGFPEDMDDDSKPLSFYNLKDGIEILMQSCDFQKK